jgi:L-ascorbate metabolism protein UlaG (beta-lactamase superfamily)
MKIQHIRNATMRMTYAGRKILADPMLAPKDAYDPFVGIARNPTVELSLAPEAVMAGIDGVIVSHNHPDHFDETALDLLPKKILLFCQPVDESHFVGQGLQQAILTSGFSWSAQCVISKHGRRTIFNFLANTCNSQTPVRRWQNV